MTVDQQRERRAIRLSAGTNLSMAVLGLGAGWVADSEAILLDGSFNAISFVMALLTLRVARLVAQPGDERYPFGYAAYEPLLNVSKSALVLGASLLALVSSVLACVAGGRDSQPGTGLVYAVVAAVACTVVGAVQRRVSRSTGSPLIEVDAKNWAVNGVISAAVGLAFAIAWLLRGTSLEWVVPYVDPVLVIVLVLVSAPIPGRILRDAFRELVGAAAPGDVRRDAEAEVAAVVADVAERVSLRIMPVGRTHFVIAHVLLAADRPLADVAALDEVRVRVETALARLFPTPACEVVLTGDPEQLAP